VESSDIFIKQTLASSFCYGDGSANMACHYISFDYFVGFVVHLKKLFGKTKKS